ncbi:MAG: hypothetical protein IKH27_07585 [Oscillospiraceae bacterium]|nr:hypothetical protein [Oscillospiraceae bacterium]
MICKRCGSQIFNNAKTCPFCAAVIGAENETDPTQNVIPPLEEIENPGNQMLDLTNPVQPPAAPVTPPAQPNLSDTPVTPPVQQNPFGTPAVQPPAQNNAFGAPTVQPPAQNNAFGTPGVQPPAQNNAFGDPAVQPPAQNNAFGTPAQQNPFGNQPAQTPSQQNAFGVPQQSAAFSQNSQQGAFAPLPPLGGSGATGSAIAGVPIRLITKIVIVLALLGFALPFVTISCSMGEYGGDQEIATYSGFALMAGNLEYEDPAKQMNDSLSGMFGEEFVNNQDEDEISDFDAIFNQGDDDSLIGYHDIDENDDAAAVTEAEAEAEEDTQRKNYYLIGAFICGVIGLVLFFIRGKKLELFTMLLCMVSALLTLLSSITFSSFYHVTDDAQMAQLIKVKTRFGLFTVVVLFVIGAIGALKEHIDVNRNSGY